MTIARNAVEDSWQLSQDGKIDFHMESVVTGLQQLHYHPSAPRNIVLRSLSERTQPILRDVVYKTMVHHAMIILFDVDEDILCVLVLSILIAFPGTKHVSLIQGFTEFTSRLPQATINSVSFAHSFQGYIRPEVEDKAQAFVFAIYDENQKLQYIGFSKDLQSSLRTLFSRRPEKAYYYKCVSLPEVDQKEMVATRGAWFEEVGGPPPGNKCEFSLLGAHQV